MPSPSPRTRSTRSIGGTAQRVWLFAILGAGLGVMLCLFNLSATHDSLGGLVAGTEDQPQTRLIHLDQLGEPTDIGGAHDGLYYYAIARDPFHLTDSGQYTDRPRYRFQRVFFPFLAWLVHPTGGGPGLVWAMFAVNAVGLLIGGLATGYLSIQLRGPPWPAVTFGVMYGSIVALRITVPDSLALALAIAALALSLRNRTALAILCGVGAALSKEPILLVFAGYALCRRDRQSLALLAIPAAAAGAWWLVLARLFPGPVGVSEFVAPFSGWRGAIDLWMQGFEPLGWISALLGLGIGVAALVRTRPSHPLWGAIAINMAVMVVYSTSVLGPERNASRVMLPVQILGIVALVTRTAGTSRSAPQNRVGVAG